MSWRQKLQRFAVLSILTASVYGCAAPAHQPSASPESTLTTENAPLPEDTEDLEIQENALESVDNPVIEPEPVHIPGVQPAYDDWLDVRSNLNTAWMQAFLKRSDGAWMRYALRLAESDMRQIPDAIALIDQIRNNPRNVDLDDIFDFHLGRLWMKHAEDPSLDDPQIALKNAYFYFDKVRSKLSSPYRHLARAEWIKSALRLGLDASDELAVFIRDYPDFPQILDFRYEYYRMLFLSEDTNRRDTAISGMQDLAFYYPWSPISKKAGQWLYDNFLADRFRPFEEVFSRVESLRKMRFWDEAEIAASEAMTQFPESYQTAVQHARIAYERSYHAEAASRFEQILQRLGGQTKDKLRPQGVIAYLFRAYEYLGDCETALKYHDKYVARLGRNDRARSTMEFALSCGALDVAYDNAKIVYSDPKDSDAAYFAFLAYLNGDYENARNSYTVAIQTLTGTYKRRAAYFLAMATLKAALNPPQNQAAPAKNGRVKISTKKKKSNLPSPTVSSAKKQFQSLINDDNADYYAILAWTRLEEIKRLENADAQETAPKTPVIQTFPDSIEPDSNMFRPWYREYTFDEKKNLLDFEEQVKQYKTVLPELERIEFLHDAELYRERNQEFRRIAFEVMGIGRSGFRPTTNNLWTTKLSVDGHLVDHRKNKTGFWGTPLTHYWFDLPSKGETQAREEIARRQAAIYVLYPELGPFVKKTLTAFHDYYMARKYTPAQTIPCGSLQNLDACSTLYPHAYSHAVLRESAQNHITPDIVWAIMNIESAFNPDSISHSDAYGLLQIIPMTGYKIANAMERTDFGPYDLIRPENSIHMGIWYFSQILHKFHGYATLSMAAYNGGPHYVARWLTAYSSKIDHDAFIELIPFNEARNYVKKGMARLLVFYRIDHQNPNAFFEIPNTLPPDFEEMPNY